jgi:hypothetical protein
MSRRRRAGRVSDFRSRGAPNAEAFVQREEALVQTADANPSAEHLRRQRDVSAVARPRLAVVSFEVPLHLTRLNPKATIVAGLHPGEGRFHGSAEHRSGCAAVQNRSATGSGGRSRMPAVGGGLGLLARSWHPRRERAFRFLSECRQPFVGISGDPGRTRTSDLQLRRLLLYPLSYGAKPSALPSGFCCGAQHQWREAHRSAASPIVWRDHY